MTEQTQNWNWISSLGEEQPVSATRVKWEETQHSNKTQGRYTASTRFLAGKDFKANCCQDVLFKLLWWSTKEQALLRALDTVVGQQN